MEAIVVELLLLSALFFVVLANRFSGEKDHINKKTRRKEINFFNIIF
jgi:hypothetical protein